MKNELKTLEDLPRLQLMSAKDDMIQQIVDNADSINSDILKQEAIKWIRLFNLPRQEQSKEENELILKFYTDYESTNAIILFIKHFYNITEEDLI